MSCISIEQPNENYKKVNIGLAVPIILIFYSVVTWWPDSVRRGPAGFQYIWLEWSCPLFLLRDNGDF